jgi:hypothetical protein
MDVRSTLNRLLEATAAKVAAETRIGALRLDLETEARRRFTEEGAAPSWKAAGLGSVRLDGADAAPKPYVRDESEFASWLAQNYPTEAVATVTVDPDKLADALAALALAGVAATAKVEPRPGFVSTWLPALELDQVSPDAEVAAIDPATGQFVPGIGATRAAPRLVVSLDKDRKATAVAEAEAELELEEADAAVSAELVEIGISDAAAEAAAEAAFAAAP